jgi:enediyne biosynthesis protein E4
VANGHVYPQMDLVKGGAPYRQPFLVFRNNGNRTFKDVTSTSGLNTLPVASRRGAAFGDLNNDGKVDVLVLNVGEKPTLLLNQTEDVGHAVLFRLVGTKSNKAAIGARVRVTASNVVQFNEVRSGTSYLSQNDLRVHFGLGQVSVMNTVEVLWPNGKKEELRDLAADFIYTIVEGRGITDKTPIAAETAKKQPPLQSAKPR